MDQNIENILETDEKIVWQGIVNRKVLATFLIISLAVAFLLGGILLTKRIINTGIVIIVIGLLTSLLSFFSDIVRNYAITQKRVIMKSGLIGTDFKSIYFDQIKNIIVDVGLTEKIFKVGSVKIDIGKTEIYSTGGHTGSRGHSSQSQIRTMYDVLKHIDNPYEVYKYLQETLEDRKESLYSGRADRESNPQFYKSQ